jgi:hypothetical protein
MIVVFTTTSHTWGHTDGWRSHQMSSNQRGRSRDHRVSHRSHHRTTRNGHRDRRTGNAHRKPLHHGGLVYRLGLLGLVDGRLLSG